MLAEAGFPVIRLRYHGTGEAPGTDEDPARVQAWLASIRLAAEAAERLPGVDSVGLVGIRLGGLLAGGAAMERQVSLMALWEPCVSGAAYRREMEILASAPSASKLRTIDRVDEDDFLEAAGYVLTKETLDDLVRLDLMRMSPMGGPRVLLLGRDDRPPPMKLARHLEESGCVVRQYRPKGFKEMMAYPEGAVPALEGFAVIREWALEHSTPVDEQPTALPGLLPALSSGGITRRAVTFGPEERLFGVLTSPDVESDGPPPGVLLLTGGVVPRTAVNRMYVTVADDLASRGHRVLRFDVSGIGESDCEPGLPDGDPFPPSLHDDVRAAISVLRGGNGELPIWLVGLCSGAYAAFRGAHEDDRVAGVVLLNPLCFGPRGDAGTPVEVHQARDAEAYRSAVRDFGRWKRLVTGQVDLRRPVAWAALSARTWVSSRLSVLAARVGLTPKGVLGEFVTLTRRGTEVHVVYAPDDPGVAALRAQIGGSTKPLARAGVDFVTVEGGDHTFNTRRIRRAVVEQIERFIARDPGEASAAPIAVPRSA